VVNNIQEFNPKTLDDVGDHERRRTVHTRLAVDVDILAYGVSQILIHCCFKIRIMLLDNIGLVVHGVQAGVVLPKIYSKTWRASIIVRTVNHVCDPVSVDKIRE
jgi:hypothetical protein